MRMVGFMAREVVTAQTPWWEVRASRLAAALEGIRGKEVLTIIQPFSPVDNDIPGLNVLFANDTYFSNDENATADIYFTQGYQPDIDLLWNVIRSGRAGVTSCWFWDNHHLFLSTMRASMLADVNFCAHSFASHYIPNELGHYGGFVPLAPVFWSNSMIQRVMEEMAGRPRRNELYGGYNSYAAWPDRDVFLKACMEAVPTNVIKMWPHGTPPDQHLYYALPPEDKIREWCNYKVALCVSFGINTTMRMFESLLMGQIPIVVGEIHDLDMAIPPWDQETLPLIRVRTMDPQAVQAAYAAALERFDAEGEAGVRRRSSYILNHHMPRNRIIQMVEHIRNMQVPVSTEPYTKFG